MSDGPRESRDVGAGAPELPDTMAEGVLGWEGTMVGPYRLLEVLGEGGMGIVWLAEQMSPVYRKVALKVVKEEMRSERVIARFEAERQALAVMDHPAVAKVFEAGMTLEGLPYFAMEYAPGVPITRYCDENHLGVRERLGLFREVCAGVQHAHQKAIIHRDLKPANVLITVIDGKPCVKIIDFGVCKALVRPKDGNSMETYHGVLIGTPEYMSPEQADTTTHDVDTRTDVYSLGVILYQLLIGVLPISAKELRSRGRKGIALKIREDQPSRPSVRLSTLAGDAGMEAARLRHAEPTALRRQLKGDLDWITMKALEKERSRRYQTPLALAEDLERYLDRRPVMARPPGHGYRMRKFIARHRVGVSLTAVSIVIILVTAGLHGAQAVKTRRIRMESERAERVSSFLAEVIQSVDAQKLGELLAEGLRSRGEEIQAGGTLSMAQVDATLHALGSAGGDLAAGMLHEEVLGPAADSIGERFRDDPLIAARLQVTLGHAYYKLGLREKAQELLDAALITLEKMARTQEISATLNSVYSAHLFNAGLTSEAARGMELPLKYYPKNPSSYTKAAGVFLWLPEKCDQAAAALETALELGGTQAETKNAVAWYSYLMSFTCSIPADLPRLRELSDAAVAQEPDNPFYLNTSGHLLLASGEIKKARDSLFKSAAIHTRLQAAWPLFRLAKLERIVGNRELAQAHFNRANECMEASCPRHPELALLREQAKGTH